MLTSGDEGDLLADIQEGIQIAMDWEGYASESVDPITVNKLAYFAIQDLGVPVTYGWYKYGPAPVFETSTARIEPTPESEIKASDEPRLPDPSGTLYSPEEYAYYFTRDCTHFERILNTPTKEYLIEFYEDHAPPAYGSLYKQCVQVQVILDAIIADSAWHTEAEDHATSLRRALTDLHRELRTVDRLSEVFDTYSEYAKLLKRVIAAAANTSDLTPAQERFVGKVANVFYTDVWRYTALLISKDTVHLSPGENDDILLNAIDGELQALRGAVDDEIVSLRRQAVERDLYTAYSKESQDERPTKEGRDTNEQPVEPWTKTAAASITTKLARSPDEIDG